MVGSYNLDEVADAYLHAITAKCPKYRYICGWDARLMLVPLSFLPSCLQVCIVSGKGTGIPFL